MAFGSFVCVLQALRSHPSWHGPPYETQPPPPRRAWVCATRSAVFSARATSSPCSLQIQNSADLHVAQVKVIRGQKEMDLCYFLRNNFRNGIRKASHLFYQQSPQKLPVSWPGQASPNTGRGHILQYKMCFFRSQIHFLSLEWGQNYLFICLFIYGLEPLQRRRLHTRTQFYDAVWQSD